MPFAAPQFNLLCNIWGGNVVPPVGLPRIANQLCQLAWDRTAGVPFLVGANIVHVMLLRVPAGTDLRDQLSATFQDVVEVPAGSGRFYTCWRVDDVARGFPNEYRQGLLRLVQHPTPLP